MTSLREGSPPIATAASSSRSGSSILGSTGSSRAAVAHYLRRVVRENPSMPSSTAAFGAIRPLPIPAGSALLGANADFHRRARDRDRLVAKLVAVSNRAQLKPLARPCGPQNDDSVGPSRTNGGCRLMKFGRSGQRCFGFVNQMPHDLSYTQNLFNSSGGLPRPNQRFSTPSPSDSLGNFSP